MSKNDESTFVSPSVYTLGKENIELMHSFGFLFELDSIEQEKPDCCTWCV